MVSQTHLLVPSVIMLFHVVRSRKIQKSMGAIGWNNGAKRMSRKKNDTEKRSPFFTMSNDDDESSKLSFSGKFECRQNVKEARRKVFGPFTSLVLKRERKHDEWCRFMPLWSIVYFQYYGSLLNSTLLKSIPTPRVPWVYYELLNVRREQEEGAASEWEGKYDSLRLSQSHKVRHFD